MKNLAEMDFKVDKANNRINVSREFDAPLPLVWSAWTQSEILDQWWAPKPYRNKTKTMNFKEGGYWLYCMISPEQEVHWCRADYNRIEPERSYNATDAFCDEDGNINATFPRSTWDVNFSGKGDTTMVHITISYKQLADLEQIVAMGFREGFSAGLQNLDHYLSTHFKLRAENKSSNKARVATYLNFPGNTEEAMLFYKQVFNGEFTGRGLQRFGDIDMPEGAPPMSEADKKLIIHAELTILGGHVLMATDAPESMGFTVTTGNNMHINLEPETREETERLFNALSAGGEVIMPLQDMFWGACFASFKDKYGINWMLNFQQAQ